MGKAIVSRCFNDYQLISIGIELVNRILGISSIHPELKKIDELAQKWNEIFINSYVSTKEGGK